MVSLDFLQVCGHQRRGGRVGAGACIRHRPACEVKVAQMVGKAFALEYRGALGDLSVNTA